jgi:hypothetical protein
LPEISANKHTFKDEGEKEKGYLRQLHPVFFFFWNFKNVA